MHALVNISGRQYRVAPQDRIIVDRLKGDPGGTLVVSEVLMVSDGETYEFGTPTLPYKVNLKIVEHGRHDKMLSYRFKRRGGARKTHGHRQQYTLVMIDSIEKGG